MMDVREYLLCFLDEFAYSAEDAEVLLRAYDVISAKNAAKTLFFEALSAYEKDCKIDYKKEILERSRMIENLTKIHRYTVDLLLFICMSKHLKTLYAERAIDMQIYKDSVLDLKWKLAECKAVKGICGSFVASWFTGFFDLTRFALGRLQFEVITMEKDYEKNGVKLEKDVSKVINVHIPRTGTPLDQESCDASYAAARVFFEEEAGKNAPFVCHSWLLYPENKDILSPTMNTYRFMSEYDIVAWDINEGQDLWRLFDTHELNPDRLPTNGSFRRAYVDHLKKGGRVGWGFGVKI